jgi:hypothetical protein
VRVELSPGDWAGVLDAVRSVARQLRDGQWPVDTPVEDHRDADEQADDLDRVAKSLREQIAEAGRELPDLPTGGVGTNAVCPECAAELYARVETVEYRRYAEWTPGGVVLGTVDSEDGGEITLLCERGHGPFACPDVEDYR